MRPPEDWWWCRGEGCRGLLPRSMAFGCLDEFGGNWVARAGFVVDVVKGLPLLLPGGRATFLKVIVHLTSSPAKTTCSCQRTKTRMLLRLLVLLALLGPSDDMVQWVGGAEGRPIPRTASGTETRYALALTEKGIDRRSLSNRLIQHC